MIIVWAAKKRFYKTMRQSIKRLVISAKLFYLGSLPCKYPCHSIVENFALIIYGNCDKSFRLSYKIYERKL